MANARTKARKPRSTVVSPVTTLREQVIRLEAAMVVCRATPKKEPVHTLRKATRYVEAQLALLELVPHLPPHQKEAAKVRRHLKRVRKAAGTIRDFDVQHALVKDDTPKRSTARRSSPNSQMHRDAKALAKHLKLQREQQTDRLTAVLRVEEKRLAKALQKLEAILEAAEARTVPAARLAASIQRWFHANTPRLPTHRSAQRNGNSSALESRDAKTKPTDAKADPRDAKELHALRKASKLCRYMAESLPADLPAAERLILLYEEIQESGGNWHDWLLLREMAAKHHGKRSALTERYSQHRDAALESYESHLAPLLATKRVRAPRAGKTARKTPKAQR